MVPSAGQLEAAVDAQRNAKPPMTDIAVRLLATEPVVVTGVLVVSVLGLQDAYQLGLTATVVPQTYAIVAPGGISPITQARLHTVASWLMLPVRQA